MAPLGQHPTCSPFSPLCLPVSWHGGFASAPHCWPGKCPAPGGGSQAPGAAWLECCPLLALLSPAVLWAHRGPCRASCGAAGCSQLPAAWCHRCLPRRDSVSALPAPNSHRAHGGQPLPGSVGWGPSLAPTLTPTAVGTQEWTAEPQHCTYHSRSTDGVWHLEQPYSLWWSFPGLDEAGNPSQYHWDACSTLVAAAWNPRAPGASVHS